MNPFAICWQAAIINWNKISTKLSNNIKIYLRVSNLKQLIVIDDSCSSIITHLEVSNFK